MQRLTIFDGTNIFYRAFYALPNLTAPSGVPTGAITGFANITLRILREYKGGREKTLGNLIKIRQGRYFENAATDNI